MLKRRKLYHCEKQEAKDSWLIDIAIRSVCNATLEGISEDERSKTLRFLINLWNETKANEIKSMD